MAKSDNRFSFTVKELNAVTCPPTGKADRSGRVYVYDADEPGLAFRVTETGARSFYVCGMVSGKFKRKELASVSEVDGKGLLDARKQARTEMANMRNGIDPIAQKKERAIEAAAKVWTLGDLWDLYRDDHLANKKKITRDEFTRLYNAHLAPWKNRPLSEITKDECRALHRKIGKASKYTANRVLAILSSMFTRKGGECGLPEDWTPTRKIPRFEETKRDRVLSPEELSAILAAIDADENELVRDYFRMMLYTGSRKGKLAEMTWQQVSIQRKTWTVPGVMMKNNAPLVVNLVDDAIAILERRSETNPTDSPYVFPGHAVTEAQVKAARAMRDDHKSTRTIASEIGISQSAVMRAIDPAYKAEAPRPFNGVQKAWERIVKLAGIDREKIKTTPHDVRRTYVTTLLESGAALMHVAAAVGHRSTETTSKHYSVARQAKVAEAVRTGVASMLSEAEAAGKAKKKRVG